MTKRTAEAILNDQFLFIRAKLLEVAADFDRIDRAADECGKLSSEALEKRELLGEAARLLLTEGPDRAERLQKLFSREYSSSWRSDMQV